ncbi:MAG: dCMP deaminase family protein [Rhizobiaceae bacterium]|nr:dCMP deaminase family protein [Rhizobiaceae bacterium]MCC0000993.1 dCMP deaminase family protein [Methylobacteriaceae bacterium]
MQTKPRAEGSEIKRTAIDWDRIFMARAAEVAKASKDPSTQVGAYIVNSDGEDVCSGYNGFPKGVADTADRLNDRPTKYAFVCHAEANAIVLARRDLRGCTIYVTPLHPCGECAKLIIQSGIKRVVTRKPVEERWQSSYAVAQTMLDEAGVQIDFLGDSALDQAPTKRECQHVWFRDPSRLNGYECAKCGEIEDETYMAYMALMER